MKKNQFVILMFIIMFLSSSCRASRVSEAQAQLLEYSLKKSDLPGSGWQVEAESWGANYGAENYSIVLIRDKQVFVTQLVSIYASETQAQMAYQEWEAQSFNRPNMQPEPLYAPESQDDDYRAECFRSEPPNDAIRVCYYIQRHNRVINLVKINLDGQSADNLTNEEIKGILATLDDRLNEISIDEKVEGSVP